MNTRTLTTLAIPILLLACGETTPLTDDGPVPLDMMVAMDASDIPADAQPSGDLGEPMDDAGAPPDTGSEEDGGQPDMGTTEPNCGSGVYDAAADKCYLRLPWSTGDFCPGFEPLRWETVADQQRIATLVAPLGPGGTGLVRHATRGWEFLGDPRTTPSGIDWATGAPGTDTYSYFDPSEDGLSSYWRGYPFQFCMRDPS